MIIRVIGPTISGRELWGAVYAPPPMSRYTGARKHLDILQQSEIAHTPTHTHLPGDFTSSANATTTVVASTETGTAGAGRAGFIHTRTHAHSDPSNEHANTHTLEDRLNQPQFNRERASE